MILFLSCKEEEVIKDCIDDYLEQIGMIRYNCEEIGCKFFLNLYEFESKQYFLLGNHCADIISYPTDCEGKTLCTQQLEYNCEAFYKKAVFIGIVGIKY